MGLLCAEQNVRLLKIYTFINCGTPVRRTKRQKSQTCMFITSGTPVRRTTHRKCQKQIRVHELWDSCAQNNTSEISKHALSRTLGLLCAEQTVGNLKKCALRRTNCRTSQKYTFMKSGTPVRRTKHRETKKCTFKN